ncbi:ATP-dependent helicase [Psittacicella gerlachiana]|uniref:DNA 3'-5' helicase n=1 Tax=Psittacicella gerlachiana TaxID=2028574 RepID=A0A3A1YIC8_9GAMM|nr:ATP-dependent helicase [Psittacicella gerlachiana]RIY37912.1 hypothetical protein CKF59_01110 [Psittacicella gerlachiana]
MKNNLNPQQAEFVHSPLENSLVLAGAGTGKTSSFIARIAHLILQGDITIYSFFATTFTNTAAKEMRERLLKELSAYNPAFDERQLRQCYIGTFHSLFGRILRNNIERLVGDIRPNFTNLEETTARSRIKEYLKQQKLEEEFNRYELNPRKLLDLINAIRETYIIEDNLDFDIFEKAFLPFVRQSKSENDYDQGTQDLSNNLKSLYQNFKKVYDYYRRYKIENNMVDFTDYLVKTYKLLDTNQDILESYQRRFNYLIVDECQDINTIQYKLIKLLHNPKFNRVSMIGDDDQSIYGFRGSRVELISQFQREFEQVKTYKLEYNYRCAPSIISLANLIVNKYKTDNIKVLQAAKSHTANAPVKYIHTAGASDFQGQAIASDLLRHKEFHDSAILARSNATLQQLEQYLINHNIPYVFKTALEFFARLEVKIVLSILTLANNPTANESFYYLVDNLVAKVGASILNKIADIGASIGQPAFLTARDYLHSLWKSNTQAKANLQEFIQRLESVTAYAKDASLDDTLKYIYQTFDLEAWLKAKKDNYEARQENLTKLLNLAQEFVPELIEDEETENTDLRHLQELHGHQLSEAQLRNFYLQRLFLQQNYLDQSSLNNSEAKEQGVVLSTVHRAKGLEWKHVYIADFSDLTMPSAFSQTPEEKAEERRIFYVAITRAKEYLYLFKPEAIYLHGRHEAVDISPYAYEFLIPEMSNDLKFYQQSNLQKSSFALIDFSHGIKACRKIPLSPQENPFSLNKSNNPRGGLASNFSFARTPKPKPKPNVSYSAAPEVSLVQQASSNAQDYLRKTLAHLASPGALNLSIVSANLESFTALVKEYKLTYPHQLLLFSAQDLALDPKLAPLASTFASQIQQTQELSLGHAIYAANFPGLDNAPLILRLARFFKSASQLFKVVNKFTTSVDFAQALAKYKVPAELSVVLHRVFKQEQNQETLLQILDAGVASNNLDPADQEVKAKRQQLGVVAEILTTLQEKRSQVEARQVFPRASLTPHEQQLAQEFDQAISKSTQNSNLYTTAYHKKDLDGIMDSIFSQSQAQIIDASNIHHFHVSTLGQHPTLTREEIKQELNMRGIKFVDNPLVAEIVFVFTLSNQSQTYTLEELEQKPHTKVFYQDYFDKLFLK